MTHVEALEGSQSADDEGVGHCSVASLNSYRVPIDRMVPPLIADSPDPMAASTIMENSPMNAEPSSTDSRPCFSHLHCEWGAVSIEAPREMPWGVKSAFVQGPGMLTIEIEELLRR